MAGPATRARPWRIGAALGLMALGMLGVSWLLLMDAGALDPSDPRVQVTLAVNLTFLFVLMLAAALDSAVFVLYARGDYDLLFSAPLPPRTVLLVRALNVFCVTVAKAALYGAPILMVLAFTRGAQWLGGLPLILALAVMATALAIAAAMALVRLSGIRAARVTAQVMAAFAGLLVLVMVQWEAIFGPGLKSGLAALVAANPDSWMSGLASLPARALTGEVSALAAAAMIAALTALAMFHTLAERFVRNATAAAGSSAQPTAKPRRSRASFGASALGVLMLKERRIILRDPWLISQILMQAIFLLPVAAVTAWKVMSGADDMAALSPVLIVLCGQIAGGLTWIALSADDASELAMTAPLEPKLRQRARLLAVGWLAAVFAAGPLMLVLFADPWTGLVSLAGVAAAIPCGVMVNLWRQPRLARAGLIRRRMKSPISVTLTELAVLTMVAIAVWPLLSGHYAAAAMGAAAVAVLLAALHAARQRQPA